MGRRAERLLDATLPALADRLAGRLGGGPCLVLGTEELMYLPLRLAALLDERVPAAVRVQSTTRSPVAPLDRDGYAVRSAVAFDAPDEPGRVSYLYNLPLRPAARAGADDPDDPDGPDGPANRPGRPATARTTSCWSPTPHPARPCWRRCRRRRAGACMCSPCRRTSLPRP